MKKKILIPASLAAVFALTISSCKQEPYLTLETQSALEFPSSGGTAGVAFSTNESWTVSSPSPWCTLSQNSGAAGSISLVLNCSASEEHDPRRCNITVSTASGSFDVLVSQKQKDEIIVSSDVFDLPHGEGRVVIDTQANVPFSVRMEDGAGWLSRLATKTMNYGQEIFLVSANTFPDPREARIYLEGDGAGREILVRQEGYKHPVFEYDVPAVLGFEDVSEYYTPGSDQTSLSRDSGRTTFRVLRPSGRFAFELGGIPAGLSAGDSFEGSLSIVRDGRLVYSKYLEFNVLKVSDGLVWLSAGEQAGAVVKI